MIEAAVEIGSGIAAHSLTLIAFGVDSVIELQIGVRRAVASQYRARQGEEFSEETEQRPAMIGAALLVALTPYVVVSAAWSLWSGEGQKFSLAGLVLAALALPMI